MSYPPGVTTVTLREVTDENRDAILVGFQPTGEMDENGETILALKLDL